MKSAVLSISLMKPIYVMTRRSAGLDRLSNYEDVERLVGSMASDYVLEIHQGDLSHSSRYRKVFGQPLETLGFSSDTIGGFRERLRERFALTENEWIELNAENNSTLDHHVAFISGKMREWLYRSIEERRRWLADYHQMKPENLRRTLHEIKDRDDYDWIRLIIVGSPLCADIKPMPPLQTRLERWLIEKSRCCGMSCGDHCTEILRPIFMSYLLQLKDLEEAEQATESITESIEV